MISILSKFVKGVNKLINIVKNNRLKFNLGGIFITFFLFFIFSTNQAEASVFGLKSSFSENIPILMYHYIEIAPASSTLKGLYLDPKIFKSQLNEIKKYNSVFISEVAKSLNLKKRLPNNSLALTFDDGYEDFYTIVFPLLKKYKIKATVYIIINALDKPGYLTKEQLKELAGSEYIEIGSHTFNHPDLITLDKSKAEFEIVKSKKYLEAIINKPVFSFCYPYGHYNNYDGKLALQAGYLASLTTHAGNIHYQSEIQTLTRLRPGLRNGPEFVNWLKNLLQKK